MTEGLRHQKGSQEEQSLFSMRDSKFRINKRYQRWTLDENREYVEFLKENEGMFNDPVGRRSKAIYNRMAIELNNGRNNHQCRSHHMKMIKKYKSLRGIIDHILVNGPRDCSGNYERRRKDNSTNEGHISGKILVSDGMGELKGFEISDYCLQNQASQEEKCKIRALRKQPFQTTNQAPLVEKKVESKKKRRSQNYFSQEPSESSREEELLLPLWFSKSASAFTICSASKTKIEIPI